MGIPRLYHNTRLKIGTSIVLEPHQHHKCRAVLRMDAGDSLRLFNALDGEYAAVVFETSKKETRVKITDFVRKIADVPRLYVWFAPFKSSRMDWMFEKATELGVTHFRPVLTEYTNLREWNQKRVTTLLIQAAEQSERMDLPDVAEICPLTEIREFRQQEACVLFADERGQGVPLLSMLNPLLSRCSKNTDQIQSARILAHHVLIGPEGGFSDREAEWLYQQPSVYPVSLGQHILRVETAILYAVSVIQAWRNTTATEQWGNPHGSQ